MRTTHLRRTGGTLLALGVAATLVACSTGGPGSASDATGGADATGASSLTLVTVGDDDSELGDAAVDAASDARARARAAATERTLTSLTSTWDWAGR